MVVIIIVLLQEFFVLWAIDFPTVETREYNSQIGFQSKGHVIFRWCHLFSSLFSSH